MVWQQQNPQQFSYELEVTAYHRQLKNPLVWLPNGPRWSAKNLLKGRYSGLQLQGVIKQQIGHHLWKLRQETEWVYAEVKNQESAAWYHPIFIPDLMLSTQLNWQYKSWTAGISWNHTGNRFTTTDNSSLLPMYSLWRFVLEYRHQIKMTQLNFPFNWQLVLHNLTNTIYENMPGRPMPPRNVELKLNIHF
jgi:iron complex outermembrane receptor protein